MTQSIFFIGVLLLAACGTTGETGNTSTSGGTLKEYEASFRPSDHDQPIKDFFPEANNSGRKDSSGILTVATTQIQELTQGYRVQVLGTTSYDDATNMKATVEGQFADEWFYIVYDAPTYKLRAGNFLERYEADRFAKLLAERGYRDAWVVPERVYKNPPPRPPQPQNLQK
jgi:hypothetical protein